MLRMLFRDLSPYVSVGKVMAWCAAILWEYSGGDVRSGYVIWRGGVGKSAGSIPGGRLLSGWWTGALCRFSHSRVGMIQICMC